MGWLIFIVIIFICSFWFVSRIFSKAEDTSKKNHAHGVADNADDGSSGADSDE